MLGLGVNELLIILVIVMLLFGSSRIPQLARSLGKAGKEFKDGVDEAGSEAEEKTKAKAKSKSNKRKTAKTKS